MNRYFIAFLVTTFLYIALIGGYLYSIEKNKSLKSTLIKSEQRVSFTVIAQQKQNTKQKSIAKPITKPITKHKPKAIEKPKKKKILKKKKLKPKKKIVKRKFKKINPKKKPVKKSKKIQKTKIKQHRSTSKKNIDNKQIKKREILKNKYFQKIKQIINRNKFYPKMALRREIEGEVKVSFIISPKGELISYHIIKGKKVFYKSALKALKNSFPIHPPLNIITKNTKLSIKLKYILQ